MYGQNAGQPPWMNGPWYQRLAQMFQQRRQGMGDGGGDGRGGPMRGGPRGMQSGMQPPGVPGPGMQQQMPMQQQAQPMAAPKQLPNGWSQRLAPGGTAPPGQALPTEQIKNDGDYDTDDRRRGY